MLVNQRKHLSSLNPTSLSFPELGTAQPQLVVIFVVFVVVVIVFLVIVSVDIIVVDVVVIIVVLSKLGQQ